MIDHAAAYAAFSNYGHKLTPRAILKVVDGNGNTLVNEPTPSPGTQVMTQAQAYAITKILRNYPSHWGIHFNRPIASKSGTTDNYIDAYYMSYSPDYVVAAWAGHTSADGHEQGMKTVYGNDVGKYISAPFVNGLPGPSREFSAVNGALTDCTGSGASSSASVEGCPTPTPSTTPTPQPSATSSPTPTPSSVPTVTFQPPPTLPIGGSPTPSPSASPAPTKPGGSPAPTPP
jgi:membrane peptidoglycan carboxypeptidase